MDKVRIALRLICSLVGVISPIYVCFFNKMIYKKYEFGIDFCKNKIRVITLIYWVFILTVTVFTTDFVYMFFGSILYLSICYLIAKKHNDKWEVLKRGE